MTVDVTMTLYDQGMNYREIGAISLMAVAGATGTGRSPGE